MATIPVAAQQPPTRANRVQLRFDTTEAAVALGLVEAQRMKYELIACTADPHQLLEKYNAASFKRSR